MDKKVDIYRFLGLPRDASPEEIEGRCEALLDWLESDSIPEALRPWASAQRALLQEVYESLGLPEEELTAGAKPRDAAEPTGVEVSVGRGRGPFLSRLGRNPLSLVTAGVFLGLAVLGALWWGGLIFEGGKEAQSPSGQEAFHPGQFLESRQGRIRELEGIVAANPEDVAALFELGETHMVGGDWERAILWFTKLLEVEPTNIHARTDIGTGNMNLGRYREAEDAFSQVLEMDPENVQAHYNMAFLFAFRRDSPNLDEAVKHWQEVVRLAPGSDLANIAQVHIDQLQPSGLGP